MKKTVIIMGAFLLGATALSGNLHAQTTLSNNRDVAQLLYQVNNSLIRQEGVISATHEAVLTAHDQYTADPNSSTYAALLAASQKDQAAVELYTKLVNQSKAVQAQIQKAEQTFYEETPATKTEIDTGPVGKDTPEGGESVASEIPIPPPMLLEQLQKEIKDNGGVSSSFAEQLKAQQQKLQSVQTRIENEMKTDAVKSNPDALKQDNDLVSALSKAINARRCALNPDECEDSSKAKK